MKRKGTNTQLDLPPNLRLRKDRAALIFRVAQEVLRNVAAHAQAKNVTVELSTEDGAAVLSIQDDGKGFSEARRCASQSRRTSRHVGHRRSSRGGWWDAHHRLRTRARHACRFDAAYLVQ